MEKSEAIAKWSELYGKPISEAEYEEICHNLNGFFKILCEWDKEHKSDIQSNKTLD